MANKEVIYVLGYGYRADTQWKYAHPRGTRTNTNLTFFDFRPGTMLQSIWLNWNGDHPPKAAATSTATFSSILDIYNFIKGLPAGSISELHIFSHALFQGPVLFNTSEQAGTPPDERDPADVDPRLKDFVIDTVLGGSEGKKFAKAFSSIALVKLWGCSEDPGHRELIKLNYYKRAKNDKERDTIKKAYQRYIRDGMYAFKLHLLLGIPVYAGPLGWGTNPYLPFGYEGNDVDAHYPGKYMGRWPPKKGDGWWRISQWFRPDRGREFYTKVLKAKLDILDYVAYTAAVAP